MAYTNQDLNFEQFNYSQDYSQYQPQTDYVSTPLQEYPQEVTWQSIKRAFSTGGYPDEEPLLQELGINFGHIYNKAIAVINPVAKIDSHIMDDTDLFGPLIFCFLLGIFQLLSGKVHFGYIYGVALLGCTSIFGILNLMSATGIDIYRVASVLGYSLLPIVMLSFISALLELKGMIGLVGSAVIQILRLGCCRLVCQCCIVNVCYSFEHEGAAITRCLPAGTFVLYVCNGNHFLKIKNTILLSNIENILIIYNFGPESL